VTQSWVNWRLLAASCIQEKDNVGTSRGLVLHCLWSPPVRSVVTTLQESAFSERLLTDTMENLGYPRDPDCSFEAGTVVFLEDLSVKDFFCFG